MNHDGRLHLRRPAHALRPAASCPPSAPTTSEAVAAQKAGFFDAEICPVTIPQKKGEVVVVVAKDEHRKLRR